MLKCRKNRVFQSLLTALVCFVDAPADAEKLAIQVIGSDNSPVPGVAVFINEVGIAHDSEPVPAIMDQRDTAFDPHVLIVQKGAAVSFPNNDVTAHHVYSFSKPNNFVLPLYRGTPPEPVVFTHDGIVTLGCNIHDGMLGYIVVVDTPVFAMTDDNGIAEIEVDASATSWEANIWSPRIRDSKKPITRVIQKGEPMAATIKLKKKLRPPHDSNSESVQWTDYD